MRVSLLEGARLIKSLREGAQSQHFELILATCSLLRRRSLGSSRNLPPRGGGRLRDEPKERLRGRLGHVPLPRPSPTVFVFCAVFSSYFELFWPRTKLHIN